VPVEPGLTAEVELTVGEADTALAMGSGEVQVLATPRIIALCEQATMAALSGRLEPNETSVGHAIQLDHVAPTRVGGRVRAEATLQKVAGRRLTFTVSVTDARGLVAAGKITRVIVDTDRFLERAH
jgi:fluoroacetyl-CoA thioesterase